MASVLATLLAGLWINLANCQTSSDYLASRNLSTDAWDQRVNTELRSQTANLVDCLAKCHYHQQLSQTYAILLSSNMSPSLIPRCNAVSFDSTSKVCDMATVDFLEDPDVGQQPKSFLIRSEVYR